LETKKLRAWQPPGQRTLPRRAKKHMHGSNNIHGIRKSDRKLTVRRVASHHLHVASALIEGIADKTLSSNQSRQLRLVAEALAEIAARLGRLPSRAGSAA
jgi:hypothetical protein